MEFGKMIELSGTTPSSEGMSQRPQGEMQRAPEWETATTINLKGRVLQLRGGTAWVVLKRDNKFYIVREVKPTPKSGEYGLPLDVREEPLRSGLDDVQFFLAVSRAEHTPRAKNYLNTKKPLKNDIILEVVVTPGTDSPLVVSFSAG